MKYYDHYIQKVYFNKEIMDRPIDEYGDRLGMFCVIEMEETDYPAGRKGELCEILTCIMKLMGFSDEISNENFLGKIEINNCWICEDGERIYIRHKYWSGRQMRLFCDITEALGKYLKFETEYLPAEEIRSMGGW